ncbi:MAG TPA: IS1 family transposase [Candidatus Saccharimonadales bacterium]|nr:IS1 family transposase [Candidatus Saccharimonadales bacterium]
MNCPTCQTEARKHGKDRKGNQRFYCPFCSKSFVESQDKPFDNMYLPLEKAVRCLQLLVEGCSLRTVERVTGVSLHTLLKLLVAAGEKCEQFLESRIQNVPVRDVECDELWCFVSMKEKTLRNKTHGQDQWNWEEIEKLGDAYTFLAFERNTKLVLAWHLGRRSAEDTQVFTKKLARATFDDSFQVTTDGFAPYRYAVVRDLEHKNIDFAQLTKVYATPRDAEARYSPPVVVDVISSVIHGNPDPARICTSIVERQNLTIRMQMRRFTRLTNAFSKKWENLKAALALFFAYFNFCRKHGGINKQTPAMAAGLTDHVWSIQELLMAL